MDKKKLMQIVIPFCLVLVVAGIWIFKNINAGSGDVVSPNDNEDFVLVTESIDLDMLTAYDLPIIIDFGSDSCIPCQQMAPVLETMNEEMQGKAIIKFVDVWEYPNAADGFPIQVIPTQVFFNADGTPYVPSENIEIEFTMYSYNDTNEHAFTVHQGGLTEDQMRSILEDMGVNE